MLSHLSIRNLSFIESVDLSFGEGFNVFTGETGAGKSILLGTLKLLAGERSDRDSTYSDTQQGLIQANFSFKEPLEINQYLETLQLPLCEDGILTLERAFSKGRSLYIRLNGSLIPLNVLRELSKHWIDFHDANQAQHLMHSKTQLSFLDVSAGHTGFADCLSKAL